MCIFSTSFIKKIVLLLSLVTLFSVTTFADVVIFGSKDCPNCLVIKKSLDSSSVQYSFVDVEDDEGYEELLGYEAKLNISSSGDLPAVYVLGKAEKIFYHSDSEVVIDSIMKYNISGLKAVTEQSETVTETKEIVNIVFFEKEGCTACSRVLRHFKYLNSKDSTINVITHKITDRKSSELNQILCAKYGAKSTDNLVTPAIFTDKGFLIGKSVNSVQIDSLIATSSDSTFWEFSQDEYKKSSEKIKDKFSNFTIYVVIFAALLDSINPCAYATLIFLVSYLLSMKKDKKTVLFSGIAFSFSVFLTYLLVGFGLLQVAQFADSYYTARLILNSLIVIGLLYYGFLNLYDYFMIKANKYNKIKLSLSFESSKKINESILSLGKSKFVVLNSFLIGFVISFLELACTGQEYLPTIIYMKETMPEKAIPLLLLYNVVFVLPIIFIFMLVYKGLTTSSLQRFIFKHSAKVKMGFFLLMMFMAAIIVFTQMV